MAVYQVLNILIWGGISIYVLVILLEWLAVRSQKMAQAKADYTVLSVRVSKENETGPLVAEQIFSTIHSVVENLKLSDRLRGKNQEKISFEIANIGRSIRFFVQFPSDLRDLVEGQIYAQYPDVEIHEVDDYTVAQTADVAVKGDAEATADEKVLALKQEEPKNFKTIDLFANAVGAELSLSGREFFPIKEYANFEDSSTKMNVDPLSGITSTLAKFSDPDEQAWIQLVVAPVPENRLEHIHKCFKVFGKLKFAKKLYYNFYYRGSKLSKKIFFPINWLLGLIKPPTEIEEKDPKHTQQENKLGKLLFDANLRIAYIPKAKRNNQALVKLREIAGSFKQFNNENNGFAIARTYKSSDIVQRFHARTLENPFLLNVAELATIYHLPNNTVKTPNIYWVKSKKLEPPNDLPKPTNEKGSDTTLLGVTNFRGLRQPFGIKTLDRRRHMYIIGKTGMGKTTIIENMVFSDIMAGRGVGVVDPHGDLADAVLDFVPSWRTNEVIIVDPSDREWPIAFNMLENIDPSLNTIVASGLVGIFKKIYGHSWGPRLEHILRNVILSLLEYPGTTMLGIPRILQDAKFRAQVVRKIQDPLVKSFWVNEFDKLDPRQRTEAISPILNKVGQFLSSPIIRNILGQVKSKVDLRFAMDNKKIVIVNLSKGKIGEDNSSLMGAMMITKFQIDAMSRSNIPEKDRVDFYLYVDEFQNFATDSFATILSEARKYKLNLNMANQYIAQMSEEVRDAVFGNVGSIVSYQVGVDDAEYLSQQFSEEVTPVDLTNLSKFTAYSRILVDGMPTKTFSFDALPPPKVEDEEGRREKVIRLARERYCVSRDIVEDKINRWSKTAEIGEPEKKKILKAPAEKKATSKEE